MSNIKQITFDRTIKTLAALGVEYIIKDSEGVVHTLGSLCLAAPAPEKKRQPRSGLPYGGLNSHITVYMDKMVVGDVVCVPIYEGGNLKSLHSAVSSYAARVWGNGNGTTHKDVANNCIEVMRVG